MLKQKTNKIQFRFREFYKKYIKRSYAEKKPLEQLTWVEKFDLVMSLSRKCVAWNQGIGETEYKRMRAIETEFHNLFEQLDKKNKEQNAT